MDYPFEFREWKESVEDRFNYMNGQIHSLRSRISVHIAREWALKRRIEKLEERLNEVN